MRRVISAAGCARAFAEVLKAYPQAGRGPEAMLKLARAEEVTAELGKLKIFLGYAAGVAAKALGTAALKERLQAQGAIPSGNTPAEFAKLIAAETAKWAQVVKASGAKID